MRTGEPLSNVVVITRDKNVGAMARFVIPRGRTHTARDNGYGEIKSSLSFMLHFPFLFLRKICNYPGRWRGTRAVGARSFPPRFSPITSRPGQTPSHFHPARRPSPEVVEGGRSCRMLISDCPPGPL